MKKNIKILTCLIVSIFLVWGNYNYVNASEGKSENISITYEEYLKSREQSSYKKRNYNNVDDDKIYTKIYNSIEKIEDSVDLSDLIGFDDYSVILDIYWNVIQDNPQLFYLKEEMIISNENARAIVKFEYIEDKATIKNVLEKEFKEKVNNIISSIIKSNMTELEKEVAIHDYIVLNTAYDKINYDNNTIPDNSYSAYGVLVHGIGVCSGYAEAMKVLLDEVGIKTEILSSPMMNHAWNIVTIDNQRYHVDATWNDPVPNRDGCVSYMFFNTSDDDLEWHYWDRSQYEPCNSTKYSYIYSNVNDGIYNEGYIYHSYSSIEGSGLARINLDSGKVELLEEEYVTNIIIDGDYIYYNKYNPFAPYSFYKANKDGSNKKKLIDGGAYNIYKYEDYIYYQHDNINFRMNLNTNKEELIYTGGISQKVIHRNNIYFIDDQKYNLYKMDLDGSNVVKMIDGEVKNLYFSYNRIYYQDNTNTYKSVWLANPGWILDYDGWSYINQDGSSHKGWLNDNGKWYYLDSNGLISINWKKIDGKWYNFDYDGAMKNGWLKMTVNYLPEGYLQDRVWIYLNDNGNILSGWQYINKKWYYMEEKEVLPVEFGMFGQIVKLGIMKTGWLNDGGKWYYLNQSGAMETGWINDGGKWYYLNQSGSMETGWINDGGKWYYLNQSGSMETGWLNLNGIWYYMHESGRMATNEIIDGWKIGSNGVASPIR